METYNDVEGFGAFSVDELSVDEVPGFVVGHDNKCNCNENYLVQFPSCVSISMT